MKNTILNKLFTPIRINRLEVKNRIVLPPVNFGFIPFLDNLNERAKDYFIARARGGVGLMILPATAWARMDGVHPSEKTAKLYTDDMAAGHKELNKALHAYGTKVGILIHHRGRQSSTQDYGYQPVAPSPISWSPRGEVPRELSRAEIANLIERYGNAGKRAKDAGFDVVEIFAAHGFLLGNFLSPSANKRTDEYGGDIKGRARFLVEIIKSIRERVGPDFVISCRMNGADYVKGGITVKESMLVAPLLVEAGLNLISVSGGVFGSFPPSVPTYGLPPLCFVSDAAAVKSVISVPVVAVGGIHDPLVAEDIIEKDKADMVAMARPLVADPDLPNKALRGELDDICRCLSCNQCLDYSEKTDGFCTVNPALGREREFEIVPAVKTKKVMVVGGGLAGMEAAGICALRGHDVTLYEESDKLGGQWLLAIMPPHKQEYISTIDYLSGQLKKLKVKTVLGSKVTARDIEEMNPDVAIVATGALQFIPPIPGLEQAGVVMAWDVLQGKGKTGKKVLVIGGGVTGLETAELLSTQGKKVTVVEMLDRYGADIGSTARYQLKRRLEEYGVEIFTSTRVMKIGKEGIVVKKGDREETWGGFDSIVLAVGATSRNELSEQMKHKVKEVYVIGDALKPGKGMDAIRQGAEVARRL